MTRPPVGRVGQATSRYTVIFLGQGGTLVRSRKFQQRLTQAPYNFGEVRPRNKFA